MRRTARIAVWIIIATVPLSIGAYRLAASGTIDGLLSAESRLAFHQWRFELSSNEGWVALDSGDTDGALCFAEKAYRIGESYFPVEDVLLGTARLLNFGLLGDSLKPMATKTRGIAKLRTIWWQFLAWLI